MSHSNKHPVIAEVEALHDAYLRALEANDTEALNRFFWDSPDAVRYGAGEQNYGKDAIAASRRPGPPPFTERTLVRRSILPLGDAAASVMSEFTQRIHGHPCQSRQSQVWMRFADAGWRIVAAHVSNLPAPAASPWEAYADRASAALGLPLAPAHRPGLIQNLQRMAAITGPLMALDLPADAETAPTFRP